MKMQWVSAGYSFKAYKDGTARSKLPATKHLSGCSKLTSIFSVMITKSNRERLRSRSYRCPSSSLHGQFRVILLPFLHFRRLQNLKYTYIYQLLRRRMALPVDHAGWCSCYTTTVERSSKRVATVRQHTHSDPANIAHHTHKAGCKTRIEHCMGFSDHS